MKAGIIGGTGFTGRELVPLLLKHPKLKEIKVYGRRSGFPLSSEIPELKHIFDDLVLDMNSHNIPEEVDILFMALPHKVSMELSKEYQNKVLLVDLSADYRLKDPSLFEKWYGTTHVDPEGIPLYTYGLPEIFRSDIAKAKAIACPGCYPTSILLGIYPLIKNKLIHGTLIIDSKSGHSGAGKKVLPSLHASQCTSNIQPYKILDHQHKGEIEQGIKIISSEAYDCPITFTPHLMDFDRGILSTCYLQLNQAMTDEELKRLYLDCYQNEPFVRLFLEEKLPHVKACQNTNFCDIAPKLDPRTGIVTIISCIDNLLKGASGQAVQAMNVAMGWDEKEGLL